MWDCSIGSLNSIRTESLRDSASLQNQRERSERTIQNQAVRIVKRIIRENKLANIVKICLLSLQNQFYSQASRIPRNWNAKSSTRWIQRTEASLNFILRQQWETVNVQVGVIKGAIFGKNRSEIWHAYTSQSIQRIPVISTFSTKYIAYDLASITSSRGRFSVNDFSFAKLCSPAVRSVTFGRSSVKFNSDLKEFDPNSSCWSSESSTWEVKHKHTI